MACAGCACHNEVCTADNGISLEDTAPPHSLHLGKGLEAHIIYKEGTRLMNTS